MEIPKEQILQMLRDRGDHDKAQQADQQFLTGLYAWLSAEATAEVGVRTGVDLPHYAELERAVMAAGAHMQRDLGPPAAK